MDDAVKPAHFGSGYGRARHLHLALARLGHMVTLWPWFDGERYETTFWSDAWRASAAGFEGHRDYERRIRAIAVDPYCDSHWLEVARRDGAAPPDILAPVP